MKSRAVRRPKTYHGPRNQRCAAARERYHKLPGVGRTRLPNVTNATDVASGAVAGRPGGHHVMIHHGRVLPDARAGGSAPAVVRSAGSPTSVNGPPFTLLA